MVYSLLLYDHVQDSNVDTIKVKYSQSLAIMAIDRGKNNSQVSFLFNATILYTI